MRLDRIKDILVGQVQIIARHKFGIFGAAIILFFGLVSLFAPLIAPYDVWETINTAQGKPAILRPPSLEFPLGTTMMGRDILSQMIYATRTTFLIGLVAG